MSGIQPVFRARFVDLLACAVGPLSWPRATFDDTEPAVWWAGDAVAFLARDLAGRLRATSRNYELGAGHPAFVHLRNYESSAGLKTRDGQDVRPDVPIGAHTASLYMHRAPPDRLSWPTTTVPQAPTAPPDQAGLTAGSAALVADLVILIGAPAFAALRAPFLDYLQAAYPDDAFT